MNIFRNIADRVLTGFGVKNRVLILGTGRLAKDLGRILYSQCKFRYELIGFLTHDPSQVGEKVVNPGVIGTVDKLFDIVERHHVKTIAVCFEDRRGSMPLDTLLDFKAMGLEVVDGHHLYEDEFGRLSIDELKPSALIFAEGFKRRPVIMVLKRIEDLIVALLGIIILAPLLVMIAILIKLDSPGPVFYKQTRIGYRGNPYVLLKFRSMGSDAEEEGIRWADLEDHRVTRVGRWLRMLRLDELPQLINVLKGEMSLVGPRPERPFFVQELRRTIPYYELRHTVRPGITGWAQIRFKYAASVEDSHMKLQYDLYYVKHLSLTFDIFIMVRTIQVVLLGLGAR